MKNILLFLLLFTLSFSSFSQKKDKNKKKQIYLYEIECEFDEIQMEYDRLYGCADFYIQYVNDVKIYVMKTEPKDAFLVVEGKCVMHIPVGGEFFTEERSEMDKFGGIFTLQNNDNGFAVGCIKKDSPNKQANK